jgi:hypothetical protein
VAEQVRAKFAFSKGIITSSGIDTKDIYAARAEIQERMTAHGAHIRKHDNVKQAKIEAWNLYSKFKDDTKIRSYQDLPAALKNLDLCLAHALYLEAINEYLEKGGKSRGSYLVMDPGGEKPNNEMGEEWKFSLNDEAAFVEKKILEISLDRNGNVQKEWVDIRPVPDEDVWFENVWNKYMRDEIVR